MGGGGRSGSSRDTSTSGVSDKAKQVLQLLRKDGGLNKQQACTHLERSLLFNVFNSLFHVVSQAEFCSDATIDRYLRARGGNVKKATKQLRASLAWRDTLDLAYLTADDFTAELANGVAFVAGLDDGGLPVMVLRMRQEFFTSKSQKRFIRFLVFTFEVAISAMPPGVDQWVMLVDFSGSSSSPLNMVFTILKLISEHYPERLSTSFFVDAPSMFYYLWKGVSPFIDHASKERWRFAFLKDHQPQPQLQPQVPELTLECFAEMGSCSNTPSFRQTGGSVGGYEDRLSAMSFLTPLSSPGSQSFFKRNLMDHSLLAADMHHRSLSFSSPSSRLQQRTPDVADLTSLSRGDCKAVYSSGSPVFMRSSRSRRSSRDVSCGSGKQHYSGSSSSSNGNSSSSSSSSSRNVESFRPYVRFCRESYDENSYRAMMRPPLGGLLSVIRNISLSSAGETARY